METAEIRTSEAVEGVRRGVQTTLSQNLADARQREEKAQAEIARVGQKQLSADVDVRLQFQSQRIDNLNATVQKVQTDIATNTETMQTLVAGIENLGDNFVQLREKALNWGNPGQHGTETMDT